MQEQRLLYSAMALFLFCGCAGTPLTLAVEGYESPTYADSNNWLCLPGSETDVCATDLTATIVNADGTSTTEPFQTATDPAIDCFYVYPTASMDATGNSDLVPGETEIFAAVNQAARLGQVCRVFAPMYRQVTLGALFNGDGADLDLAYADVLDAFKHYMANHNEGRGVALVGHSQGARHLRVLLQEEFDEVPEMLERLVTAYIIGATVEVPEGEDVGLSFQSIPLCRETTQTGCVVSYATYRSTVPSSEGALFGAADNGVAACNNPASLKGGEATLTPYLPMKIPAAFETFNIEGSHPFADEEKNSEVTTPYFTMPHFLKAECVQKGDFSYLEIRVNADPSDPRADDIGGDFLPGWGLHVIDISVAMGDLLKLLTTQAEAFTNGH